MGSPPSPPALPLALARRLARAARRGGPGDLTRLVLEGAKHLTGADRAVLVRAHDAPAGALRLEPAGDPVEISLSAVRRSLEDGLPVVAASAALQEGGPSASARRLGLRWVASFPLPGARLALYLDSRHAPRDGGRLVGALLEQAAALLSPQDAGPGHYAGPPPRRADGPCASAVPRSPDDPRASAAPRVPHSRRTSDAAAASATGAAHGAAQPPAASPADARLAPPLALIQAAASRPPASAGLHHAFAVFLGRSTALAEALQVLDGVAPTPLPVLLLGETGTGKELAARALHLASSRAGRLVAENCAALPAGLVESELFGSARGAFTGAERDRPGLLQAAHRGTLFLDEVADMPPAVQAKLLRVLQEGEVRPLGRTETVRVDLRVVSATSRRPEEAGLRPDLLFRLGAVTVRLPALRERRDDLPELSTAFLEALAGARARFSREAMALLVRYDWPGNVRQLRFEVERAAALAGGGVVEPPHLSEPLLRGPLDPRPPSGEREMIERALRDARGEVATAARAIGWTRQKLYRRMDALDVPRPPRSRGPPGARRADSGRGRRRAHVRRAGG